MFRLHGCGEYFPFSRVRIGYAGYFAGDGAAFRQGVERAGLRSGFVRAVGIRPAVDVESGMDVDEAYLAGFRSDRVGGEGCIIGMGADGFAFRQGNGNGGQVPGSFVQEEDVFSVAIDKGKRAGTGEEGLRCCRSSTSAFWKRGTVTASRKKRMPKTATMTVNPPPMMVLVMMRSNHSVVFAT